MRRRLALLLFILAVFLPVVPLPTPLAVIAAQSPTTILLYPNADLSPKMLPDATIAATAQAVQDEVNAQFAPAWGLEPIRVVAIPRGQGLPPASPRQWVMNLAGTTNNFFALGYHDLSPHGVPYGVVGVGDAESGGVAWTLVLSHELDELLIDPFANRIALGAEPTTTTPNIAAWLVEVCDPVVDGTILWGDRGVLYAFADFAYPSEFDQVGRYPFDKLHLLHAPFGTTPSGYLSQFTLV